MENCSSYEEFDKFVLWDIEILDDAMIVKVAIGINLNLI